MANIQDEKRKYIYNRGFRSSIRLNHNHWMMKEMCGYLIHPKIGELPADARVADIGAGTGIWLMESAAKLPGTIRFDGFDISSAQFPPKPWWPANVSFHTHDAFQPFPLELQGQFDVVHARFFLCLVNDKDAEPLLKNLVSLLKPGGYLQWFEPDANNVSMKSYNPDAPTDWVTQLATTFRKPRPDSSYNWLVEMPRYFSAYGLSMVEAETLQLPDYLRLPWGQSMLAGVEDLVDESQVAGMERAEAAAKFIDGLDDEFRQGVSLDTPWLCFVGRKN